MKPTKGTLAKIFALLPFAVYCIPLCMYICLCLLENSPSYHDGSGNLFIELEASLLLYMFFFWIPSLVSSVLGIVFSILAIKAYRTKRFLICSLFNLAVSVVWGLFALWFTIGFPRF